MRKVALLFLAFVPAFMFGAVTIPAGAEVVIDENNLSDYSQGIVFASDTPLAKPRTREKTTNFKMFSIWSYPF